MDSSGNDCLAGSGRLATWPLAGRPIRMGALDTLSLSDAECVASAVRQGDWAGAAACSDYLDSQWQHKICCAAEWIVSWAIFINQSAQIPQPQGVMALALANWRKTEKWYPVGNEAFASLSRILQPGRIAETQQGDWGVLADEILASPRALGNEVRAAISQSDAAATATLFSSWLDQCRYRHDLLFSLVWAIASAVAQLHGQEMAEKGLRQSISECSFNKKLAAAVTMMGVSDRVLALAENLRTHFSGPHRNGEAKLEEHADYYRITCNPCGSGGAMRRCLATQPAEGFGLLGQASASTWNLAGKVPLYCAHCAQNEIRSIEILGYPLMVTEFSADPLKPCGWLVYKAPEFIPEEYFTRLGLNKDRCLKRKKA